MNIKRLPNTNFNTKIRPEIGSKIVRARKECGLSQIELAKLIGFRSGTAISLIESNKRSIDAIRL